jgi:hypothetical protein
MRDFMYNWNKLKLFNVFSIFSFELVNTSCSIDKFVLPV